MTTDPHAANGHNSAHTLSVAETVRHDIEHTLEIRYAKQGTPGAEVEDRLKRAARKVWDASTRRPMVGIVIAAGAGLALATVVGVGELAVATTFGYAAYRVLALREKPEEAIRQVAKELTRGP